MTIVITVIAIILLVMHFAGGRNAVWGGATLGVLVGLILSLVRGNWSLMLPSFAWGTIAGAFFQWVPVLLERVRPESQRFSDEHIQSEDIRSVIVEKQEAQKRTQLNIQRSSEYYVSDKNRRFFHRPDCSQVQSIGHKNKIQFESAMAAFVAGNHSCPECKPPGLLCPKCGSPIHLRYSPKGKFYACSHYPSCKYILSLSSVAEKVLSGEIRVASDEPSQRASLI